MRGASGTFWSPYLTQIVDQVVLQESIPAQIRQLILYISNEEDFSGFVRELTFPAQIRQYILYISNNEE